MNRVDRRWNDINDILKRKEESRQICLGQQPERTTYRTTSSGWFSTDTRTETVERLPSPYCQDVAREIAMTEAKMRSLDEVLGIEHKTKEREGRLLN